MIPLTRLNGHAFVVNPDLLERAEATPDTVVTLVDGSRLIVLESVEEIIERIIGFRAAVAARAHAVLDTTGARLRASSRSTGENVRHLPLPVREA